MSNIYNKIFKMLNKYRKYILMLIDTFIVVVSYLSPHVISGVHPTKIDWFLNTWYLYTFIYIGTFIIIGVYKNIWRYAGIQDIFKCLQASVIANLLFLIITKSLNIFVRYYVYVVAFFVTSFCTMAIRVVYRAVLIIGDKSSKNLSHYMNIMIVGAGQATVAMLNEINRNNPNNYLVRCIVDDDKTKVGRNINSVPVVSSTEEMLSMVKKYDIEEIIISIPSLDKKIRSVYLIFAQTQNAN